MITSMACSPAARATGVFWRRIVPYMSFNHFSKDHKEEYAKLGKWWQNISYDEWSAYSYASCIYNYESNRERHKVCGYSPCLS